jgi:signal peptidase I, bacterial type
MWNSVHTSSGLRQEAQCGPVRQAVESLLLLAIAVTIFRGFAVEGYMISTGSMAPTLLGYHHQVTCPECTFSFARGAHFDEESDKSIAANTRSAIPVTQLSPSRCPCCGFSGIIAEQLPRTEGDQLLVHKHAYEFRDPRRWEVIVFRNPNDARQAYVKRVVGLPGETVEIRDGEIFINQKLARKPYSVQRGTRIPVSRFDLRNPTGDPDLLPSWVALSDDSRWDFKENSLECRAASDPPGQEISWIGFRHWIVSGGNHVTRVPLKQWPEGLRPLDESAFPLRYENGELQTTGVFTDLDRRAWLSRSDDPDFHRAINQLALQSHIAPITDEYGYNALDASGSHLVNEFSLSMALSGVRGEGRLEIELSDGENVFTAVLRPRTQSVEILQNGDAVPIRTATLPNQTLNEAFVLDFSLIDQQVVFAINGKELTEPYLYERTKPIRAMRRPVRLGVTGLDCEIRDLTLSRDIYYTKPAPEAPARYRSGPGEFVVLGDNSPVSIDSRFWDHPAIPRSSLIGKPVVVHLPSKTGHWSWGGHTRNIRLPDFSRVRIIR